MEQKEPTLTTCESLPSVQSIEAIAACRVGSATQI
jgi:hypothetical protein